MQTNFTYYYEMATFVPPKTACTGRWGFCRIFKHFSVPEFFLLPNTPLRGVSMPAYTYPKGIAQTVGRRINKEG